MRDWRKTQAGFLVHIYADFLTMIEETAKILSWHFSLQIYKNILNHYIFVDFVGVQTFTYMRYENATGALRTTRHYNKN